MVSEFRLPGLICFGWGAAERVGEEAAKLGRLALLVTGKSAMKQTGITDRITKLLAASRVAVVHYDQVESDPSSTLIDKGARFAKKTGCDLVIGLGGGSPMDAARGIAAMVSLEGSILDYIRGKPIDRPGLPLINIAATSGTASEITHVAVILDEERKLKMGIRSPYWFARVAITDPELTLTMPPRLTAGTGMDALTHAIESYVSTRATAPSQALALRAIELVGAHLRTAVADGSNRAAREGMSLASMTSGMGFANSGLGLVHGLVHPIGARYRIPHGEACGRLLPYVMWFNAETAEEDYARVGKALTGNASTTAEQAIEAVESLLADVEMPSGLQDIAITPQELTAIAKDGMLSGAVRTNPRAVTEEESLGILQEAMRL